MIHPLVGCHLKLARARVHFDSLNEAIERVIGAEPYRIPGEFDPHTNSHIFRAQRPAGSIMEWATIIGDVVHNLSAALDYLAWELTVKHSAIAHSDRRAGSVYFPIFADEGLYLREAPKKIWGIHPDAQTLIKQLQPYQARHIHPSDHPLMLLYRLEQWGKHRTLNLTTYVASARSGGIPRHILTSGHPLNIALGTHEEGAIIGRMSWGGGQPHMGVYLDITPKIAFHKDAPAGGHIVTEVLPKIIGHVTSGVIPQFHRFFP
jgi:hypothetical protein